MRAARRRLTVPLMRLSHGVGCVQAPAAIDITTEVRVRQELEAAAAASQAGHVVLDLADVDFIDSTGFGLMAGAYKRAAERGALFVLIATPPRVLERLRMFGFERHFQFADTLEAALVLCGAGQ